MDRISPETCRAARALLDLNQNDLSDLAGVSRATIVDFEKGARVPIRANRTRIQEVLESQGVEFVAGGVIRNGANLPATLTRDGDRRLGRILRALQRNKKRLRELGIVHLSVFGSTARGEAGPESDIDLLVDLDSSKNLDLFDYAGITGELRRIIDAPVDVSRRDKLKPHVAPSALADEIRVF